MSKTILITFVLICFANYADNAMAEKDCRPASCGDLHDIRYPFRLKSNVTSANNCLNSPAELLCEQNRTMFKLYNGTYYVLGIDYERAIIQVVDPGLLRDTCPFRPIHRLTHHNFSSDDPFYEPHMYFSPYWDPSAESATFYDCRSKVEFPDYIKINCSNSSSTTYSYIKLGDGLSHLLQSCNLKTIIPFMLNESGNDELSFSFIRNELRNGFRLSWSNFGPEYCYGRSLQSLYCFGEYVNVEVNAFLGKLGSCGDLVMTHIGAAVNISSSCFTVPAAVTHCGSCSST